MDGLGFATLAVVGFTACAEFGSYAFVHPVIRRLPAKEHIFVEQGLLRTFGRVMPMAMTACVVLSLTYALAHSPTPHAWRWAASGALAAALVSTIIFNVPINLATGRWDASHPPPEWRATRNRWEFFQGLRSWLLLVGFVLLCIGFSNIAS
jgi:hypothetical protein